METGRAEEKTPNFGGMGTRFLNTVRIFAGRIVLWEMQYVSLCSGILTFMKSPFMVGFMCGIVLLGVAGYYVVVPHSENVPSDGTVPKGSTLGGSVPVIGTAAYPASGTASIVEAGGKRYVHYQDLTSATPSNVDVYLAKGLDGAGSIDLGPIKTNHGNINYDIPAKVRIQDYPYVLNWSTTNGMLVNYADFSRAP